MRARTLTSVHCVHAHTRFLHCTARTHALQVVQEIVASGANVVVSQGAISEMALHFIERAGLMAVRLSSKFDNRRCGPVALPFKRSTA